MITPKKCPACNQDMRVCVLRCPACGTEVKGEFVLSRLGQLSGENLMFLETFIRCRGSLKDVGTALDISYPTARNRLDALIQVLELEDFEKSSNRLEILRSLDEGEITTEQAIALLNNKKS